MVIRRFLRPRSIQICALKHKLWVILPGMDDLHMRGWQIPVIPPTGQSVFSEKEVEPMLLERLGGGVTSWGIAPGARVF